MKSLKLCIRFMELDTVESLIDFLMLTSIKCCVALCPYALVGMIGQEPYRRRCLSKTSTNGANGERKIVLIMFKW